MPCPLVSIDNFMRPGRPRTGRLADGCRLADGFEARVDNQWVRRFATRKDQLASESCRGTPGHGQGVEQ